MVFKDLGINENSNCYLENYSKIAMEFIGELFGTNEDKTFAALFYIDLLRSMTPEERAAGRCVRRINKEDADSDWFLEILDHLSWAMTYIDGEESDNNTRKFMFIFPYESEEAKKFSKYD